MPRRARRTSPLRVLGLALLAAAVLGTGWAAWVYVGTNMVAASRQQEGFQRLAGTWAEPVAVTAEAELPLPAQGEPAWVLEIPRLGVRVPVLAGTSTTELAAGVGWYPTTNLPGQVGNMAIAGNRLGNGEPFRRLLELREDDEVVVESRLARYTYAIRVAPAELTVQPGDSWVLDPVPGQEFNPHEAVLTLTTAQDLYPTDDRAVGFAVLQSEETK